MKLKPLSDNVVVKPMSAKETTASGIFLPDNANKEKPEKGEVLAVGPGKIMDNGQLKPMNVKIGDKIMFKKYSPDEITIDEEDYLLISEGDILGVLE